MRHGGTFLLFFSLAACSSSSSSGTPIVDAGALDGGGTISADGYDASCTTASDCVVVADGNVCDSCTCPTKAIALSAQAGFDSDFDALRSTCPSAGPVQCSACASLVAVCNTGRCGAVSCTAPDGCVVDAGTIVDAGGSDQ